jgi:hypothetical protein
MIADFARVVALKPNLGAAHNSLPCNDLPGIDFT